MEKNKLGNWNDEKCEKEYFYICEGTPGLYDFKHTKVNIFSCV